MISIIIKNKLFGIILLISITLFFACKKETLSIPISTTPKDPKDTLKTEVPETGILEIFEPSPFIEGKAFGTKTIGNKLDLNKKSEIEIISVDEKQQQIKGKFNAHFNVYGKAYSPSFPIRVSFTDVIFECKVK